MIFQPGNLVLSLALLSFPHAANQSQSIIDAVLISFKFICFLHPHCCCHCLSCYQLSFGKVPQLLNCFFVLFLIWGFCFVLLISLLVHSYTVVSMIFFRKGISDFPLPQGWPGEFRRLNMAWEIISNLSSPSAFFLTVSAIVG